MYQYRMADILGKKGLRNAIRQATEEGWEPVSIAFGGVKGVSEIRGALVRPDTPPNANVPIFVALFRKRIVSQEDKPLNFEDVPQA